MSLNTFYANLKHGKTQFPKSMALEYKKSKLCVMLLARAILPASSGKYEFFQTSQRGKPTMAGKEINKISSGLTILFSSSHSFLSAFFLLVL